MERKEKIIIPEGCFEGNCSDCIYANHYQKDNQGRVKCNGPYGGYNHPSDRNGCIHHKR